MDDNQEQISAEPTPLEQAEPVDTRKPWHAPVLGVIDIADRTNKTLYSQVETTFAPGVFGGPS